MLQAKVLQLIGNINGIDLVLRQAARYSCRLCGADGVYCLLRWLDDPTSQQRDGVRELKIWLDHHQYRNVLYRALWALCRYKRPAYKATGRRLGLDPDELRLLFRLLDPDDRDAIANTPEPKHYSKAQVWAVVAALEPHIRKLTKRRLRYCYENDRSLSKEDFWGELQVQAVKIIRKYEILGLPVEDMVPLVAQSITNHCTNLAIFYGKDCRNPLQRIQQRNISRMAWYCCCNTETINQVRVFTTPKYRRGQRCLVTFRDRPPRYVAIGRLYEDQGEAEEALRRYQAGKPNTQRELLLDLTTQTQDDWQPTCCSLETPGKDDEAPIINFLVASDEEQMTQQAERLLEQLRSSTDPRAHTLLHLLNGDLIPLFDPYCQQKTGRSSAELSEGTLGRLARRYCGLSLTELSTLRPM